ncbi:MAG: hypothetical protein JNN07_15585 [Verrucomicrobiales bacterium]|nr:hypothetical protein [Verrucomicrobiales bacterium]
MSAEPDNTIEKALRDYARRRREQPGAPEGLHAANRRLLQSEVQRSYGAPSHPNPQVEKRLAWWFRWQGLASLATAVIALCGVVVWWAYQDSGSQMQLAQGVLPLQTSENRRNLSEATDLNQPSPLKKRAESEPNSSRYSSVPPPPAAVSPPNLSPSLPPVVSSPAAPAAVAADAIAEQPKRPAESARTPETRLASAPAPAPPSPAAARRDRGGLGETATAAKDLALPAQPARVETLHFRQVSEETPLAKSEFSRAQSLEREKRKPNPQDQGVLNEFRIQHSHGQLTILDQDGSEYRGYLSATPEPDRLGLATSTKPSSRGNTLSQPGNQETGSAEAVGSTQYHFLASGTNRSLQQPMRLEGQLRSSRPLQSPALSNTHGSPQVTSKLQTSTAGSATETASGLSWEFQSAVSIGTQRPVNLKAIQIPTEARSLQPNAIPRRPNR